MRLSPGTRLGPYEIAAPVGAGGMGEVYRGRDLRLDRSVAVKILPAEFSANAQFRLRFEREAKTLSSLSHPHICTLHDIGHQDGIDHLVMEYLEGESLAERLRRGPLPMHEVLRYGVEIADALGKAHRQGVTHRDLKPGNVMITKAGAKLLDFGLAKPSAVGSMSDSIATAMRSADAPLTAEGTIVGTFQYMAPEQLEGLEADARTDIFAFGAVLYEMTTGKRAFDGKTKTSLIAAIVTATPPQMSELQPVTPPALEHVVEKCLAKDPDSRWQSAHDIAEELRWIAEAGSQAGVPRPVVEARLSRRRLAVAFMITGWIIAFGAAATCWFLVRRLAVAERPMQTDIAPPDDRGFGNVMGGTSVLSPDGRFLAFRTSSDVGQSPIHIRDLETAETTSLAGTEGAIYPFWSPDGESLGFFAGGKLKTIKRRGGPVQTLCNASSGRGGTWNERGVILFAPNIREPLHQVPENGGQPVAVTKLESEYWTHRLPHFLPDGKRFLYVSRDTTGQTEFGSVWAGSLDGSLRKLVVDRASNAIYSDGYLFFVRERNLMAQKFDLDSLTVQGQIVPVAEKIEYFNARDIGHFSLSRRLLAYKTERPIPMKFAWFDATGREVAAVGEPGYYSAPFMSSDGRKAAFFRNEESDVRRDIWVMDLERGGTSIRATFLSAAGELYATLSPDGNHLAISAEANATGGGTRIRVWTQSVSGKGEERRLLETPMSFLLSDWSRDGRYLLGGIQNSATGMDLYYVPLTGDAKLVPILATRYDELFPVLSPDGRWLAYRSDESGRNEIYVTSFPDARRKWQISRNGGVKA
ncbi:MAG TPA: protein kinase, partial [Thermoanaerobaculia bacterium]|nr:protein kinase [Thermoanaerobaculia bacterium]